LRSPEKFRIHRARFISPKYFLLFFDENEKIFHQYLRRRIRSHHQFIFSLFSLYNTLLISPKQVHLIIKHLLK